MNQSIWLDEDLAEQLEPRERYGEVGWLSPSGHDTPREVTVAADAAGGIEFLVRYPNPGAPFTEEPLDDRSDPPVILRRGGGSRRITRLYVPPQRDRVPLDRDALVTRLNEAALRQERDNWRLNFKFIANILAAHWNDLFPSTEARNGQ